MIHQYTYLRYISLPSYIYIKKKKKNIIEEYYL